jgi:uncharacterized membrane protein
MAALSTLGIVHTAISLIALGAGIRALVRYKEITPASAAGLLYIVMTVLTCVTGFFIFAHGGFGKPHALGILTLLVIAVAAAARFSNLFGRHGRAVETVSYSLTFFFHMIPGVTETTTRLPLGSPIFANAEAPELVVITGAMFLVFLAGAFLQLRRLRASSDALASSRGAARPI